MGSASAMTHGSDAKNHNHWPTWVALMPLAPPTEDDDGADGADCACEALVDGR